MAKTSMKIKQQRKAKFQHRNITAVEFVVVHMLI